MAETTGDIVPNSIDRQAHEFLLASCLQGGSRLAGVAAAGAVRRRGPQAAGANQCRPLLGGQWRLHGFPQGAQSTVSGGGGRQRNPELEALRFTYMKLRLATFWWSFGLSLAGFVISLVSIAIALVYGDLLLR